MTTDNTRFKSAAEPNQRPQAQETQAERQQQHSNGVVLRPQTDLESKYLMYNLSAIIYLRTHIIPVWILYLFLSLLPVLPKWLILKPADGSHVLIFEGAGRVPTSSQRSQSFYQPIYVTASFDNRKPTQCFTIDTGFEMESVSRPKSLKIPNYGSDKNVDGKRCKTVGVVTLTVSHENYYLLMSKLSFRLGKRRNCLVV